MLVLDYETLHRIMLYTQSLLERACFDFSRRAFPGVLERKGWDCVAALELDLVIKAIDVAQRESGPGSGTNSVRDIVLKVVEIRNATVHRHRLSAQGLCQFLHTAMDLLRRLEDDRRLDQMIIVFDHVRSLLQNLDMDTKKTRSLLEAKEQELNRQIRTLHSRKDVLRSEADASLDRSQTLTTIRLERVMDSVAPRNPGNASIWLVAFFGLLVGSTMGSLVGLFLWRLI